MIQNKKRSTCRRNKWNQRKNCGNLLKKMTQTKNKSKTRE